MKRRLTTLAGLALAVLAPSIASAAVFRTSVEAPHKAPTGAWVKAQGQLYRNQKAAGYKHRFDHTYRWLAFTLHEWKAFEARGRHGTPPPPKGQWQHPDSALQLQNAWRTQSPGSYVLTVRTRKTGWVNAGFTKVTIGRPIARRPSRGHPCFRSALKSIRLARRHIKLAPHQKALIAAVGLDQRGQAIPGIPLQYRLHGGGHMNGHSFIAGAAPGTYKLEVLGPRGRICEALTIEIIEPLYCAAIRFSQTSLTLDCGDSAPISAQAFDQHGRPMAIGLSYQVRGGRLHNGQFTAGQRPGTYQVIARHPGSRAFAALTITVCEPPRLSFVSLSHRVIKIACGQTVTLSLQGYDQFGNPCALNLNSLRWGASGGQIASGSFCAHKPGAYLVTVTDPHTGLSDRALIVVS